MGHRQRPDPVVDTAGEFGERTAVGGDRVPHANKVHVGMDALSSVVMALASSAASSGYRVSRTKRSRRSRPRSQAGGSAGICRRLPIGVPHLVAENSVAIIAQDPLAGNQSDEQADGESAAAEPEAVDLVAAGYNCGRE